MSSSSSSSQSPTRRATGSGADRSASAPPSSGAARDNSHRQPTASSSLPSRRHMRSESAIEPTQAALPAESSPGGRRPWHRRAREISAAAAARQALAESEGQRQENRTRRNNHGRVYRSNLHYMGEEQERLRYYATSGQEVPSTVAMTARPEIEAPRVERAPPLSSSAAESSRPRLEPQRAQPGRAQPRVQVARLREGVLRVLRERGYVPTADPDGGVSKMTPEQIEQYIPHGASLGSLLHGREEEQECAPCLFHAKRRCLRGAKCLFCHEDGHEGLTRVKQRIRPSKRTRNLLRTVQEQRPDLPPEDMMKIIQDYKRDILSHRKPS
ncbi:hypothetical protein FOZ60_000643 [Perkinsus olseni]|uniref:C3H1-type domain-containing protein n=1 Tax=Perkinsus olseni TaxID=32597 RepID=A0A7J6P1V2_PEROL|nr:hypothetical protein FOZ60_000643 [Perkinsus olseni]